MQRLRSSCGIAVAAALLAAPALAAPPPGFIAEAIGGTFDGACGVAFLPDGRTLVWERAGRVWIIDADGERLDPPLLDISDEVGAWRDHGLLGVALHPNFASTRWIYLLYAVDRHHLDFAGTPQYDPQANHSFAASIGRVVRYTAIASGRCGRDAGACTCAVDAIDPESRVVLLGHGAGDGIPILHQSHGVGTLLFGTDGTLLLSTGDSASYIGIDAGGQVSGGYLNDALARGIIEPWENVGSFRSQMLESLCGKVLRLDPATGAGVPSNPWFDPDDPGSVRSRVWCLGLRNPYRMALVAGTGSHHPSAGDPGTLAIGDVGWNGWEELNIARGGENFGWPLFEGLEAHADYWAAAPAHPLAPRSAPAPGCGGFYSFRDLLVQAHADSAALLVPDPCWLPQAESGTHVGAPATTAHAGWTGSGARRFVEGAGAWIEVTQLVSPPIAGLEALLAIRYALEGDAAALVRVEIDGDTAIESLALEPTGHPEAWRVALAPIAIGAGSRQIRLHLLAAAPLSVDAFGAVGTPGPAAVESSAPSFVHARPALDWKHAPPVARVPGFNDHGAAAALEIGAPGTPVAGEPFRGSCAIGGPFVTAPSWPQAWRNRLYVGDYVRSWIRALALGPQGEIEAVDLFDGAVGLVAALAYNPSDESLWAVRWGHTVLRFRYAPGGNQPPVALAQATPTYGPGPLAVVLDASASFDPEGGDLHFTWHLGDGSPPIEGAIVEHLFTATPGVPTAFHPTVEVRDPDKGVSIASVLVSVNNTPPTVAITSLHDGQLYTVGETIELPLRAAIADLEHGPEALACVWQVTLVHNDHTHPEPPDPACESSAMIDGYGCGDEHYHWVVSLTVTDAAGLSATDTVELFPDCFGVLACAADLDRDGVVGPADLALLLAAWGGPSGPADLDRDGMVGPSDLALLLATWGECPPVR
jgi:glucose/arabinose dehydrogenase